MHGKYPEAVGGRFVLYRYLNHCRRIYIFREKILKYSGEWWPDEKLSEKTMVVPFTIHKLYRQQRRSTCDQLFKIMSHYL